MRILILTPNYNPDLGPSAPLYSMLAENLVQRGHAVTVITAVPHYPSGQVPAQYRGKLFWHSQENNVRVIRVGLPSVKRQSLAQRLFQFLVFQIGATLAGLNQRYDVSIVANPALQVWLPFFWLVVLRCKPAIFSVHDLYPDVGIELGIFKTKSQIAFVTWLERYCLNHATFVRILSDSFLPGMRKLKITDSKIILIYDWVDTKFIQPLPHDNLFSLQNKLGGKFVVLYAGNIGLSQGLEHLLNAAEILANQPNIQFVCVGDGTGKKALETLAQKKSLPNVQFIPFQPRQRLPEVLACADISVVILKHGLSIASLPSKIFSIMASQRPILISVDVESESWRVIKKAEAGMWVPAEEPAQLAEAILTLKDDDALRDKLGDHGRAWARQYHSPMYAAEQFEKWLDAALQVAG